jgi:gamma-glutamylcyclotransferase (GGCT)/AIG2-like uncharacterized protein YtfP
LAPDYLFVYGTLRRGSGNQFARLLAEQARFAGAARVRGRLYDFGRYPGARPEDGSIAGELFQFDASSKLLATLDDYEGPEYERAIVTSQTEDGLPVDCWIYWYVGADPGQFIAAGDWLAR